MRLYTALFSSFSLKPTTPLEVVESSLSKKVVSSAIVAFALLALVVYRLTQTTRSKSRPLLKASSSFEKILKNLKLSLVPSIFKDQTDPREYVKQALNRFQERQKKRILAAWKQLQNSSRKPSLKALSAAFYFLQENPVPEALICRTFVFLVVHYTFYEDAPSKDFYQFLFRIPVEPLMVVYEKLVEAEKTQNSYLLFFPDEHYENFFPDSTRQIPNYPYLALSLFRQGKIEVALLATIWHLKNMENLFQEHTQEIIRCSTDQAKDSIINSSGLVSWENPAVKNTMDMALLNSLPKYPVWILQPKQPIYFCKEKDAMFCEMLRNGFVKALFLATDIQKTQDICLFSSAIIAKTQKSPSRQISNASSILLLDFSRAFSLRSQVLNSPSLLPYFSAGILYPEDMVRDYIEKKRGFTVSPPDIPANLLKTDQADKMATTSFSFTVHDLYHLACIWTIQPNVHQKVRNLIGAVQKANLSEETKSTIIAGLIDFDIPELVCLSKISESYQENCLIKNIKGMLSAEFNDGCVNSSTELPQIKKILHHYLGSFL